MITKHYLLRGLLWIICLYHIAVGVLANMNDRGIVWVVEKITGSSITPDAQMRYLVKPFGVYVIVFGVLMGLAAWNPVKNRSIISVGVGLFIVRAVQRFVFANELETLFNITHQRNMIGAGVVTLFALALLVLRLRLNADIKRHGLPSVEQAAN